MRNDQAERTIGIGSHVKVIRQHGCSLRPGVTGKVAEIGGGDAFVVTGNNSASAAAWVPLACLAPHRRR